MNLKRKKTKKEEIVYSHMAWQEEGRRLFGDDLKNWRFICPSCQHVASFGDWEKSGAPEGAIAYSCVSRFDPRLKSKPKAIFKSSLGKCNYAGGGLFNINPVKIEFEDKRLPMFVFDFDRSGLVD